MTGIFPRPLILFPRPLILIFKPIIFFTLVIALVPALVSAQQSGAGQDLERWLKGTSNGRKYTTIETELHGILQRAESASVPAPPLLDKIKEGAAKNVPPARLLSALEDEFDRLRFASSLVERFAGASFSRSEVTTAVKDINILLLSGLSQSTVERLFASAQTNGKPVETTLHALHTILEISAVSSLQEDELVRLGEAILASRLPPAGFDSLVSVFLKAGSRRLSGRETVDIVSEVLYRGGGLLQIEEEMNRRSRRR